MRRPARIALGLAVLVLLGGGLFSAYHWAAPATFYRPDFSLTDLDGVEHSSADYDGHVVVLNFWATWCAPCRKEMPMLASTERQLHDKGLRIIGIAIDEKTAVVDFAQDNAINYPLLPAPVAGARLQDQYTRPGTPAGVLPYTAIIDRRGQVVARFAGALTHDRLMAQIEPLLSD